MVELTLTAAYIRFGNRLADGRTMCCNSISTIVLADEYNLAFYCYLQHYFFNQHLFGAGQATIPVLRQALALAAIL